MTHLILGVGRGTEGSWSECTGGGLRCRADNRQRRGIWCSLRDGAVRDLGRYEGGAPHNLKHTHCGGGEPKKHADDLRGQCSLHFAFVSVDGWFAKARLGIYVLTKVYSAHISVDSPPSDSTTIPSFVTEIRDRPVDKAQDHSMQRITHYIHRRPSSFLPF